VYQPLKSANPGRDINAMISEQWKTMEDKSEWEQLAQADRDRYDREMEEYKAGQSDK
jgi:hypothetical protein